MESRLSRLQERPNLGRNVGGLVVSVCAYTVADRRKCV
jgi:hypothetical protein